MSEIYASKVVFLSWRMEWCSSLCFPQHLQLRESTQKKQSCDKKQVVLGVNQDASIRAPVTPRQVVCPENVVIRSMATPCSQWDTCHLSHCWTSLLSHFNNLRMHHLYQLDFLWGYVHFPVFVFNNLLGSSCHKTLPKEGSHVLAFAWSGVISMKAQSSAQRK